MRVRVLAAIVLGGFLLIASGLFYFQIIRARDYRALSERNRIRLVPTPAPRGNLLDRSGRLLVGTRLAYDVVVISQEVEDWERTFSKLSALIDRTPDALRREFQRAYTAPFAPVAVAPDVDRRVAFRVEEARGDLPGVLVLARPVRFYPLGTAGAHLFGFLGEIDRQELTRLKEYGYKIKDLVGRAGIERQYDSYLRGEEGGMQIEVDHRGRVVRLLGYRDPVRGKDLVLTIDLDWQKAVDEELAGKKGACVVIDPHDGAVLAMASSPGFDPNLFIRPERGEAVEPLFRDTDRPMLNRAFQGLYPPGSVFKMIVATAALESHRLSPGTSFVCGGAYRLGSGSFECWKKEGHGPQNLTWGIAHSCNVYFFHVGRLAGADAISRTAHLFGLGQPTGIDLPGEVRGLVPSRAWKRAAKGEPWYEGDTLNFAIGQGDLLVTPLQILRYFTSLCNGGDLVSPYVVKKIDGVDVAAERRKHLALDGRTLDAIREGLKLVVASDTGTGFRARQEAVTIAAKTGSAQAPGESHAWFCGFAPAENPKVAFIVFLEHGGSGGFTPALMVKAMVEKLKQQGVL